MPRSRKPTESPEGVALDTARRAFDRTEKLLDQQREELRNTAIEAVIAGMPIAEAARRGGYSREYLSKLVKAAKQVRGIPTDGP